MNNKNILALHERALRVAVRYRACVVEMIEVLAELDQSKAYIHFDCTSLHHYAMRYLKLSEDTACDLIRIARVSATVPELKENVAQSKITVSAARKICSVLTPENKDSWLEMAARLPRPELEKQIAKVYPKEATPERIGYVTENRVEVRLGLDEKVLVDLKWVQDHLSQSRQTHATLEDTLAEALKFYRSKKDLTKKVNSSGHGRTITDTRKLAIARDGYRCTHQALDGSRCTNTRWLDVHHIIHKQHGGDDSLENLTTLCSAHHRARHRSEEWAS